MTPVADMTNDELRRAIAKRLGYQVIMCDGAWRLVSASGDRLIDDDGYFVQVNQSAFDFTRAEALDYLILNDCVPDWANDLNAAAELLEQMVGTALYFSEDYREWIVTDDDSEFCHASPARAICEAFLLLEDETT